MRPLAMPKLTRGQRAFATLFGAALLIGGVAYSISQLGIGWDDLRPGPLLVNLLLIQPAIVAFAAVTLRLSGKAIGSDIALVPATRTVGYATFAEILPLPGGAMVRGAALMRAGADLSGAASIVTVTAFLSLSLIVTVAAGALAIGGLDAAIPVVLAGLAGVAFFAWRIFRRAGAGLTAAITAIRLSTIAASGLSVHLALQAIDAPSPLLEALIVSVSGTLGSVVTIVPAGLGIGEAIAAGLATMTSIEPAAAFLALALHRSLALVASLAAALLPGR